MIKIDPKKYEFIWRVKNFSFLQTTIGLQGEYLKRDFLATSKNGEWKTYASKEEKDRLGDIGLKLIEEKLDDFKKKIKSKISHVRQKFKEIDEIVFSRLPNKELKNILLDCVKCTEEIMGVYFWTEFFCHDEVQQKIENLDINKKEYLSSSPLKNIVSQEEYERYKLAKNPTKETIKKHLEKFDFVPYKDGKPRWTEKTLLENIKSLKNVEPKIKEIEKIHQEIIRNRKHHKLTDGVRETQELKFLIRIFVNKIFFPGNIVDRLLAEISKRFKIEIENLHMFHYKELCRLLDGEKIEPKDRTTYIIGKFSGWKNILGEKALKIIDKLEESEERKVAEFKGQIGNKGYCKGRIKVIETDVTADLAKKIDSMNKGEILVSGTTGPEKMMACRKAGAIITEEGGICSHAAIVSRELGIPCIIGTKIATKVLKDGDQVEIDANHGIIKKLKN